MHRSNRFEITLLAIACLSPLACVLSAQADCTIDARDAPPDVQHVVQSATCFRAQPLAACRAWIPFNLTTVFRLAPLGHQVDAPFGYAPGDDGDIRAFGAVDIGYMRNRDSSDAIGALIEAGTGGIDKRLALKVRAQRWLMPCSAVSASFGLVRAKQQVLTTDRTTQAFGATADLGVDFGDLFGILVTGDVTRQGSRSSTALRAGLRADSYLGAVYAALFGLIYVTVITPVVQSHKSL